MVPKKGVNIAKRIRSWRNNTPSSACCAKQQFRLESFAPQRNNSELYYTVPVGATYSTQ